MAVLNPLIADAVIAALRVHAVEVRALFYDDRSRSPTEAAQ
jgi:hypothetical protein